MTWQEVLKEPGWQDLSSAEQAQVREFWVDQEIVPELQKFGASQSDINGARSEANQNWDNGVGAVSSFGSAAAQGFLNTGTAAVQGVGALTGSEGVEQAGRDAEASVNETFRTNPVRENTNFVGNVLGNVGAFLATGGTGGAAGKAIGVSRGLTGAALEAAAKTGAQVGSFGTGFFAGAGGGAKDADQYGMTGGTRWLRAAGGGAVEVLSEMAGGMGSELGAISRIPRIGALTGAKNGLRRAVLTESYEEGLANTGGNLLNTGLAPEGVETPGVLSGLPKALAGGAIGGAAFGGINALRRTPQAPGIAPLPPVAPPPSAVITANAQEQALASGDPAAAAEMQRMQPNAAPRLQYITNPLPAIEKQASRPFDETVGQEFNPETQPPLPGQEMSEPPLPQPDVPGLVTTPPVGDAAPIRGPEPPFAPRTAPQPPLEFPQLPPDAPSLINNEPPIGDAASQSAPPIVEEPALPQEALEGPKPEPDDGVELDLFGEPVQQETSSIDNLETQEIPVNQITLSPDVPQFKAGADNSGVVEKLGGKFERLGAGPILLWRRKNGKLEVISGRHRLDLARRSGETTIPSQIVDEASGFTRDMALTADAELNIRDEKGTIKDFASYFRNSQIGEGEAEQRGLLARAPGRAGWAIGRDASDALFELHQNERISDKAAADIAAAAPGNEALQRIGAQNVLDGQPIDVSVNLMRAAQAGMADAASNGQQMDLFGSDDTAMETMRRQAKNATAIQRRIREQISAVQGAAKRPDLARKLGVNVNDPAAVQETLTRLRAELDRWQNWPMHPDLVAQTREDAAGGIAVQQSLNLPPAQPARNTEREANDPQGTLDMSLSPQEDISTLAWKLRPAFDRLVQKTGSDSVFISDLVNESGLPLEQVQQWLREYGINQGQATLDTGDWSHATEEQRAANVMLRDQERLYVQLHPGVGTGAAPVRQQAPAQTQPAPSQAANLKEANLPLWEEGAALLTRADYIDDLDQAIEALTGPHRVAWAKNNVKPSERPATQIKKLLAWADKARAWANEQQRSQPNRTGVTGDQSREVAQPQQDDGPSVFDQHGRITEADAALMARALGALGVSRARIVINDTGFPEGATDVIRGVKGQRVTTADSDTIYLNRNAITADTPMHEVFHGLIAELQASMPDLYNQGVDILRNSPALREIQDIYGPMGYSESRLMEEALATVLGNESPSWLRNYSASAPWVQALQRWIAKVRVWLNDTFGNAGIDPDMTLREFAQGINRRVLAGQLRETGLRQQQAAAMGEEDLSVNPLRQEPRDQRIAQSGLAANQEGSPVWRMAQGVYYEQESGAQALAQAQQIYNEGQAQGFTFDQHFGRLTAMVAQPGNVFNMTPGSYWGLMMQGLRIMRNDTSVPMAQREAAAENMQTLTDFMAGTAAAGGQFIKGFDFGLRIGNDPETQVENMSMRAAVGGEQEQLNEFRGVTRNIRSIMGAVQAEALDQAPEAPLIRAVEQATAAAAQADDASVEAEQALEDEAAENIKGAEKAGEENAMQWIMDGISEFSAKIQALAEDWLITVRAIAMKKAAQSGSDFSLSPAELDAKAAERMKQFTLPQLVKMGQDQIKNLLKQTVKAQSPAGPKDVKGLVKKRLADNINRLLNPKAKGKKTSEEKIAAAIANVLMAKAGMGDTIPANEDAMVMALAMTLSNQDLARESVAAIHAQLQASADTKDAITQEKLKGFMSLMVGQDLSPVDGAPAPYGEKQIADLLRRELKLQQTTLAQSVRSAALQGRTVEQLEANLRDPFRGLTGNFEPAVVDRIVNAITGEYGKSAKQRLEAIARRQEQREAGPIAARNARREAIERKKEFLRVERVKRQIERRARAKAANQGQRPGPAQPLNYQELQRLMGLPPGDILPYIQREFGLQTSDLRNMYREESRLTLLESRVLELTDQLGLDETQAQGLKDIVLSEYMTTRAERESREARRRENRAALEDPVREARREVLGKKRDALKVERMMRQAARRARVADLRRGIGFGPESRPQPLTYAEAKKLMGLDKNKVIDHLSREYGFKVSDIVEMARPQDRQATVEQRLKDLADHLGLSNADATAFMQPVIAEAMKTVDAKRLKEAEKQIKTALDKLNGTVGRKVKKQPTALDRMTRLMKLGGLDLPNVEKVLLSSLGAKEFSPSFKAELKDFISKSNDPDLPNSTRAFYTQLLNTHIQSVQGASVIGILGQWTTSNIFGGFSTFKMNAVAGGVKAISDWGIMGGYALPAALRQDLGIQTNGLAPAMLRQALRGYSKDAMHHATYMLRTGVAVNEGANSSILSNSDLELIAAMPDTPIRAWMNGDPVRPFFDKGIKALTKYHKYVRRVMVGTDLLHRTPAYLTLKAGAVVRLMHEQGKSIPNTAEAWGRAFDDMMYKGDFEAAKRAAYAEADNLIAQGKSFPQLRGILFGEILDRMEAESLGIPETRWREMLDSASNQAKRATNQNITEGGLGLLSDVMVSVARKIPGLKFMMPAIKTPINCFAQALDWSPWGYLRSYVVKQSGGRYASVSTYILNRDGTNKSFNLPAEGITSERAIELRTKMHIGSTFCILIAMTVASCFDKDDDDAVIYITGRGPTDIQQQKLWKERGYRPFMIRAFGVPISYQESPAFAPLAALGAWSDSQRYGKPDDTTSDQVAYALTRSVASFADALVLRNLGDALAGVTGNQTYNPKQAGQWTSRLASVVVAPRIGAEINTILWGPQSGKEQGWAGRALGNIPFIPALFNKPAQNFFGEEIHNSRGGMWGEVAPTLAHRIIPLPTNDDQLNFVAKMGAAPLQTRRRFKDGVPGKGATKVMDDYDTMRKWNEASGKALRKYFTPEVMARYRRQFERDRDQAEKDFDSDVRDIRENELRKFSTVQF